MQALFLGKYIDFQHFARSHPTKRGDFSASISVVRSDRRAAAFAKINAIVEKKVLTVAAPVAAASNSTPAGFLCSRGKRILVSAAEELKPAIASHLPPKLLYVVIAQEAKYYLQRKENRHEIHQHQGKDSTDRLQGCGHDGTCHRRRVDPAREHPAVGPRHARRVAPAPMQAAAPRRRPPWQRAPPSCSM